MCIRDSFCVGCALGLFQTGNDECLNCPDGSDTRNASNLYVTTSASSCIACVDGTFQTPGSNAACADVGNGKQGQLLGSGNVHAASGAKFQVDCATGTWNADGTGACANCGDGSDTQKNNGYVASAATQCKACSAGQFQTGNDQCAACQDLSLIHI